MRILLDCPSRYTKEPGKTVLIHYQRSSTEFYILLSVNFPLVGKLNSIKVRLKFVSKEIYGLSKRQKGFPGGTVVKNLPVNAGSIPGSGRSLGGGNGKPLQYSYLRNPKDKGAWQATAHGLQIIELDLATEHTPIIFILQENYLKRQKHSGILLKNSTLKFFQSVKTLT